MPIEREQLLADLKHLRRGLGLADPGPKALGPALYALSGAEPDAGDQKALGLLRTELARLVNGLPSELRQHAGAALNIGLGAEEASDTLEDRIARLSELLSRNPRTVRRRIDEAMERLADAAIAEEDWAEMDRQESSDGWYIKSVRAILRLDLQTPEAVDEREIAVSGSPLSGISLPFTLPRHPDDRGGAHELRTDMLFGGKFVVNQRVSDSRFDIKVQFPSVLQPGDTHRYAITYRIPKGQQMTPHFVYVPYRRCDEFELIARFNEQAMPAGIRRINAAFHREIEDRQPNAETLLPDGAAEVRVRFTGLRVGFAYGIQWGD